MSAEPNPAEKPNVMLCEEAAYVPFVRVGNLTIEIPPEPEARAGWRADRKEAQLLIRNSRKFVSPEPGGGCSCGRKKREAEARAAAEAPSAAGEGGVAGDASSTPEPIEPVATTAPLVLAEDVDSSTDTEE